jgi:arginyl-tRNA synthetase
MKQIIKETIEQAIEKLFPGQKVDFLVDFTKEEKFGDLSTNVAMVLAKQLKKNPLEIAEMIRNEIQDARLEKIEVAAPGYLNFSLSKSYFREKISEINKTRSQFGSSDSGKNLKINNEFISANPTGPLQMGNGRGGFYGDVLSRVLKKCGYAVVSEYYINDGGSQVIKLGHSVIKDKEAVYQGDYIEKLNEKYGHLDFNTAGKKSAEYILKNSIQPTISEKMKIHFDLWLSERKDIVEAGLTQKAIGILKEKNCTYEKDGALWLATSKLGDEKDRVLIKSDGQNAYLASDCGYLLHKIERKFDKLIIILGADHHGYKARLNAAAQMLGFRGDLQFIIVQLVRLVKDGKEVRMSKRAGNVVNIDELIDKVGLDVARFFFLMYSPDTHMNFDLKLAQERSQKNPVYYVQYAYARISSILKKAKGIEWENNVDFSLIKEKKELSLIKELIKLPDLIDETSQNYEIHKLPHYAIKLADKFHSFYNAHQVIDKDNPELSKARLNLVNAVRIVLGETLRIIGVNAPEKM